MRETEGLVGQHRLSPVMWTRYKSDIRAEDETNM
jgi:hypothetical protein